MVNYCLNYLLRILFLYRTVIRKRTMISYQAKDWEIKNANCIDALNSPYFSNRMHKHIFIDNIAFIIKVYQMDLEL